MSKEFTLSEITDKTEGKIAGDENLLIKGVATLKSATKNEISFFANTRYAEDLSTTSAGAVILPLNHQADKIPHGCSAILSANPYLAFCKVMNLFYAYQKPDSGIKENVVTGKNFQQGDGLLIYPFAVIGDNVKLGDNTVIYPHVYIGDNSTIGSNCIIYPNVSIREGISIGNDVIIHSGSVVGSDGFGYAVENGEYLKIPHKGGVIIGNDVEIAANCSIDRGVLEDTIIEDGVKLDNQVHIAHNCHIGKCSVIAGQSGLSGSTTLGHHVVMGGQSGVTGHLTVGNKVTIAGRAVVTKNTDDGKIIAGFPGRDHKDWLKQQAAMGKLGAMQKKLTAMEKRLAELEILK